jgi:8-oxo-dGTP pyrophosphatase MutT (NUDIX family)
VSTDRVRALLRAHRPADAREAAFLDEMLALTDADDPFARSSFAPGHFTASAFVWSPDRSALLLVLHGKLHRWLQPGGHFEPGEDDPIAAARREVREEVGVVADGEEALFDVDVHVIPARGADPAHRHYDLRVLLQARTWAFRAGSDAREARWVPLGEVTTLGSDESVLRAVRRLSRR